MKSLTFNFAALCLVGTLGCEHQSQPIGPRLNEVQRVIVGSAREKYNAIYELDVERGEKTELPVTGLAPVLSPTGSQLVFYAESHGGIALFVGDMNGVNLKKIAQISESGGLAFLTCDWSPDGKRIVYASPRENGNQQIFLFDLLTNEEKRLTEGSVGNAWDPYFSPDGLKISYVSISPAGQISGANIMNVDGTNKHSLMQNTLAIRPLWSPDAREIVFGIKELSFDLARELRSDIFLCDANEFGLRQLTFDGRSYPVAWSPDGKTILFASERDGPREYYLMDANGDNQERITRGLRVDIHAYWSPDGSRFAFLAYPPDQGEFPVWLWDSEKGARNLQVYTMGRISWIPE